MKNVKMKTVYRLLSFFCVLLCSFYLNGQELEQTKWKTTFNNSNIIVEFTTDSLNLIIGNERLDISTYSIHQDTLTLIDHPGSACSDTVAGLYLFSIVNDTMFVELVSDSCENRMLFFTDRELVKCITSSVAEPEKNRPIVFPNPNFSNRFFVKNAERISYYFEVFNSLGQVVQSGEAVDVIDVLRNESMLFLNLKNKEETYSYKLILN